MAKLTSDQRKQVVSIITKRAKNTEAAEKATDNTELIRDLGIASVDTIDIVLELEDTFGLKIEDDEVTQITTIGAAVALLEAKLPQPLQDS